MPELEPITREEKFLNGEVGMTPITREEKILAGEDIETVTRREYFLKKYRGGGGDITVEEITITENGTTTAPSGKAYSPIHTNVPQPTLSTLEVSENGDYDAPSGTAYNRVNVNVPLPTNAYLLKSVANLPQAIASFNDGEDMVMPSLKVAIEPQQDLHGYDAPWVGGAGKNKFDQDTAYASYKQSDGGFRITGNTVTLMKNYIPQSLVGQQVTVSVYFDLTKEASPNGVRIACNIGGTEIESSRVEANEKKTLSLTFTPTATTDYWYITYGNTGANYFTFKDCQLEIGSTATTFAPYSNICPIIGWSEVDVTVADATTDPTVENVYTIDLDGTRYGCEVDVVNGTMTMDKVYVVYDGSADENWFKYGSGSASAFAMCSNNALLSNINAIPIASYLKGISRNETWGNYDNWVSVTSGDRLVTGMQSITEVEDWKTYLSSNNLQVVYELATPLTIQLTPTAVKSLLGSNNVWADTGDITDAKYFSKEV